MKKRRNRKSLKDFKQAFSFLHKWKKIRKTYLVHHLRMYLLKDVVFDKEFF